MDMWVPCLVHVLTPLFSLFFVDLGKAFPRPETLHPKPPLVFFCSLTFCLLFPRWVDNSAEIYSSSNYDFFLFVGHGGKLADTMGPVGVSPQLSLVRRLRQ